MGRIARSFELVKQSYRILMKDKELLILPVLSGLTVLVLVATFAFGIRAFDTDAPGGDGKAYILPVLLLYIAGYTAVIFFQAAIIAGASERLGGGDPTLGSALRAAAKRFPSILMWGAVAGTVGLLLKMLQDRSEGIGRFLTGVIGVAWSLATFFIVPVLVMEGRTVGESFRESWRLFKGTWGETVIGTGGLGFVSFLCTLPFLGIGYLLYSRGMEVAAFAVGLTGVAVVSVFFSALQGVYVAALYRYARTREVAEGFDQALVSGAFVAKNR
jgi:hypothetical protein